MITDKCKCGSTVTISHSHYCKESSDHKQWLNAHAICREGRNFRETKEEVMKGAGR